MYDVLYAYMKCAIRRTSLHCALQFHLRPLKGNSLAVLGHQARGVGPEGREVYLHCLFETTFCQNRCLVTYRFDSELFAIDFHYARRSY